MTDLDQAWVEAVCAACDPVFDAANVGFLRQVQHAEDGTVGAVLWEADPRRFAERYPDSGIVEAYGAEQWSGVPCIDYWVYVDHVARTARVSVEGWNLPEVRLPLRGDLLDATALADLFARILGVPSPRTG
ncbi:hypothetical protein [Nocardioides sp. MH1]|uniref:hypothetical protein n=1 Tax=Nocardioides sp. MH1 TaxID=3242490 RepID=UPI0035216872